MQFELETNQTQTQVLENRPFIFYIMDISEKSHFPLFCFEEPFKHFSSTRVASLFSWISHGGSTQARHSAGRSAFACVAWVVACVTSRVTLRLRGTSAYNRICRSIISYSLHKLLRYSFLWIQFAYKMVDLLQYLLGFDWPTQGDGCPKKGAKNWQDKRIF